MPCSVRSSRLVICGISDSWPGNVQTNDDGIEFSQGRRGEDRRMESSSSRGEGCLHVRRRWAHTHTHQRHVCPQASSRVGLPCTQIVRTPPLPSPIDNEISSPCMSSCPSSKDSPQSHTSLPRLSVLKKVLRREREGGEKANPADLASQYLHVGLPVRECKVVHKNILIHTRARSERGGESCPHPNRGLGLQPTRVRQHMGQRSLRGSQQRC